MVCRSQSRGQIQRDRISTECNNPNVYLLVADCGLERDVRRVWSDFVSHRESVGGPVKLDALICNAGSLSNDIQMTDENVETTIASHLIFGTYLFVNLAMPVMEGTDGARVIVVSSGGMYNTKFPTWGIATSNAGKYNGQLAYAYAKRGQVLLCERWTTMYPKLKFVSCHPGWVDTEGVNAAYGKQKKYLEPMRSKPDLQAVGISS
jgi:dehydrogenase/reductase SDR family protein 12